MNWEVILWTCATVAVMLFVIWIVFSVISALNMKKRRKEVGDIHTTLKVGEKVIFAGGLHGKVTKITEDTINVEISKGVVVTASRFSIQAIDK